MADFGLWMVEDHEAAVTDYASEYQQFYSKAMLYYTEKNGSTPDNFWGCFVNGSDFKLNLDEHQRFSYVWRRS